MGEVRSRDLHLCNFVEVYVISIRRIGMTLILVDRVGVHATVVPPTGRRCY